MSPEPPESTGYNDDEFDPAFHQAISGFHTTAYQPPTTTSPYGTNPHIPADSIPVKPGLTKRGRAALTIGAVVLAGGGLITWQHHADTTAANELRAKELQLQQDKLALEQQKALDKAHKAAAKTQTAADQARQAKVDACVNQNKDLVGKQLGYRMGDVIDDCQKQYPATTDGTDMQEAASSADTGSSDGTQGLLLGAGALLIGGVWIGLRRATRPPAPQGPPPYPHPYYPQG